MTWLRYLELCEYWQRVPPLAETVAGLAGVLGESPTRDVEPEHPFAALEKDFGFATS